MGKKSKRQNRPKKGSLPGKSGTPVGVIQWQECTSVSRWQSQSFFQTSVKCLPPEEVVEKIRRGFGRTTMALAESINTQEHILAEKDFVQNLVDAGVVSVLLDFLGRANDSIRDIVGEVGTAEVDGKAVYLADTSIGEEMVLGSPSIWCHIISHILANWNESPLSPESLRECRMQVARKIGTLVNVMCDDMNRICYRENSQWHQSLSPFLQLISGLVSTEDTIQILLDYDGLLRILVQCIFWLDQRPDIVQESKRHGRAENLLHSKVALFACSTLTTIMKSQYQNDTRTQISIGGRECIQSIGSTVVVNKLFDPSCEVSFMAGLISLLKTKKGATEKPCLRAAKRRCLRDCVMYFIDISCPNKSIIREVLNLGNHVEDVGDAIFFLNASDKMIWNADSEMFDDYMAAYAVNKGLFHVIVKLLSRFGSTNSDVVHWANHSVQYIHCISTRGKLPKALANISHDDSFLGDLQSLGDTAEKTKNGDLAKLVLGIRTELFLKGVEFTPTCSNCQKSLARDEAKYCSRCYDESYCSRECQVSHWVAHKNNCIKTDKEIAKRIGKSWDESQMLAGKLLHQNSRSFLIEAIAKGLDILDCYVFISLQFTPPRVHLLQAGSSEEESIFHDLAESQPEVQKGLQNFYETAAEVSGGGLLPAFVFAQLGEMFAMSSTNNFTKRPWPEAQRLLARDLEDELAFVRSNPDERDEFTTKLQLQRVSQVLNTKVKSDEMDSFIPGIQVYYLM